MSNLVICESVYGHTKQYAEWIAQALGCEMKGIGEVSASDLDAHDTIIFGGPIYVGKIKGLKQLIGHKDALAKKRLILFTTGMTPPEKTEAYTEVLAQNVPTGSLSVEKAFHFPGEVDPAKLKLAHSLIFKMVSKMTSSGKAPEGMDFSMDKGPMQRDVIEPLVRHIQQ